MVRHELPCHVTIWSFWVAISAPRVHSPTKKMTWGGCTWPKPDPDLRNAAWEVLLGRDPKRRRGVSTGSSQLPADSAERRARPCLAGWLAASGDLRESTIRLLARENLAAGHVDFAVLQSSNWFRRVRRGSILCHSPFATLSRRSQRIACHVLAVGRWHVRGPRAALLRQTLVRPWSRCS